MWYYSLLYPICSALICRYRQCLLWEFTPGLIDIFISCWQQTQYIAYIQIPLRQHKYTDIFCVLYWLYWQKVEVYYLNVDIEQTITSSLTNKSEKKTSQQKKESLIIQISFYASQFMIVRYNRINESTSEAVLGTYSLILFKIWIMYNSTVQQVKWWIFSL